MSCDCRDYQKSKVYRWERQLAHGKWVEYNDLQAYVNRIWEAEGLKWPPLVEALHKNDSHAGKADRHYVYFPKAGASEQTILHELGHSMTGTINEHTDGHGPAFVGVYMALLNRHLDVPLIQILYTADKDKVDFDIFAKAWCGK